MEDPHAMEVDSPKPDESSSSSSDTEEEEVEWLAKGRARRTTAGNHMSSLLDAEADDDLALLFAEEEEDEEFKSAVEGGGGEGEGGDEADDMEMESSSDEDYQGPEAGVADEELQGEKELQQEAKRLAKKRKAQEGLRFTTLRKKVKIDPTAGGRTQTIPAPRPKKKSERISWLPTPEDGPTRSSSRRQTMQNKQLTHARLKDSEEKRVRLIATMEEAAKRKEKLKPKQLTQADRLAEAAKTEKRNSKSLNRWEEMEKRRGEEQKARLEALQNRRLEGAVATWWSGVAKWINGRLAQVGSKEIAHHPEKGHRKNKGRDVANSDSPTITKEKKAEGGNDIMPAETTAVVPVKTEQQGQDGPKQFTFAPPQGPESFLDGIHLYASMNEESQSVPAVAAPSAPAITQPSKQQAAPTTPLLPSATAPPQPAQNDTQLPPQLAPQPEKPLATPANEPLKSQAPVPAAASASTPSPYPTILPAKPPTPPPPTIEHSSRNLMVLENFESRTTQERNEYSVFFNSRKAQKLQKPPQETCPITSRPARYRDPNTGLPYATSLAYREIRQTLSHRYAWSGMLGCFVGPIGVGARGVPERFLAPNAPPPIMVVKPTTGNTPAGAGTGTTGAGGSAGEGTKV